MTGRPGQGQSTLAVCVRFESGVVGTLLGSYDSSYSCPRTRHIEMSGAYGQALIQDSVNRYTFSAAGESTRRVWEAGCFDDAGRPFARTSDAHLDRLLAIVRAGEPQLVPAAVGLRALAVSQAIVEAFEPGRRVAVPTAVRGSSLKHTRNDEDASC